MRPLFLVALLAASAAIAACGSSSHSSTSSTAPATAAEQVSRGQALFGRHCAKCHGDSGQGTEDAPRIVGLREGALPLDPPPSRKVRKSRFVNVGDVADFVMANMPAKKPGSLQPDEYLAILAFDLHANGIDLDQPLTLAKARQTMIPR